MVSRKDTTWGEVAIDTFTSTGLGALTSLDGPCISKNQRCLNTVIEHPTGQTIKNAVKFTGKVYLNEQIGDVVINATKEYSDFWLEKHFCR